MCVFHFVPILSKARIDLGFMQLAGSISMKKTQMLSGIKQNIRKCLTKTRYCSKSDK